VGGVGVSATRFHAPLSLSNRRAAGQQLLAEVIWSDLSTNRPSWLGTVNPFNAEITALFGNQGGYDG